jgi:hypothetical protein
MLSVLTLKYSAPEAQGANASALQLSDALVSSAALAGGGLLFDPAAGNFGAVLALSWALALVAALLSPRVWLSRRADPSPGGHGATPPCADAAASPRA